MQERQKHNKAKLDSMCSQQCAPIFPVARANSDEVNVVLELCRKVIGAGATSMIVAAQPQFNEVLSARFLCAMDPKQVVFTQTIKFALRVVSLMVSSTLGSFGPIKLSKQLIPMEIPLTQTTSRSSRPKFVHWMMGVCFPFCTPPTSAQSGLQVPQTTHPRASQRRCKMPSQHCNLTHRCATRSKLENCGIQVTTT